MKALYHRGSIGGLDCREDPVPEILAPSDALVRPPAASTCDLDQAIVRVQTAVLPFDQATDALTSAGFTPVFVRDPVKLD